MLPSRLANDLEALFHGGLVHETVLCRSDDCRDGRGGAAGCDRCLPRFRTVLQIDGDLYLKIWREPVGDPDASESEVRIQRFHHGLRSHQKEAAERFGQLGREMVRLSCHVGRIADGLLCVPPLGGALASFWASETIAAAVWAAFGPLLLVVARRRLRRLLLRLAIRHVMRLAYRAALS